MDESSSSAETAPPRKPQPCKSHWQNAKHYTVVGDHAEGVKCDLCGREFRRLSVSKTGEVYIPDHNDLVTQKPSTRSRTRALNARNAYKW